jgi:hypothetical protein
MDDLIDLDEAIELIMQRTGKNRRQAKAALFQKMRSGELTATGENIETGQIEIIPRECWPQVN